MKIQLSFFFLLIFTHLSLAFAQVEVRQDLNGFHFNNFLKPFTSDGCSKFPDGIPGVDKNLWQGCCIQHDIAYYQGGTAEQRKLADEELQQCVGQVAPEWIGTLMKLGVRIGGHENLPMSWRWGYGWIIHRSYKPLTDKELKQVNEMLEEVSVESIEIINQPVLADHYSSTRDLCIDRAGLEVMQILGGPFYIKSVVKRTVEKSNGFHHFIDIKEKQGKTFQAHVFTVRRNGCTQISNELLSRSLVRFLSIKPGPNHN